MGFCVFNNIAVAAAHALEVRGLSRIAIVDYDVHHGNGTQVTHYQKTRYQRLLLEQARMCYPSCELCRVPGCQLHHAWALARGDEPITLSNAAPCWKRTSLSCLQ
jgi:acetoin utilization deacetylase AcuC-like enzyme